MRKLTDGQKRYLLNLIRGESVNGHCRTQSDYGGLAKVAGSLRKRGLVTLVGGLRLTEEGMRVATALATSLVELITHPSAGRPSPPPGRGSG